MQQDSHKNLSKEQIEYCESISACFLEDLLDAAAEGCTGIKFYSMLPDENGVLR